MFDYKHVNFRINFYKLIIISSILISGIRSDGNDDEFCWHPECMELGEDVLGNMLPRLDPCQDFYEYACGNFKYNHPPPTPKSDHSVINVILERIYKKLSSLLSTNIQPTENDVIKKSKLTFQACMNLTRIKSDAIPTLKKILDNAGGFPMMYSPAMYYDSMSWEEIHSYFARITGIGALVNIDVSQDYRLSSDYSIYLDQPSGAFGLFNRLTRYSKVVTYAKFIKEIMMLLIQATGTTATEQTVERDIQDVFKFRYSLQSKLNTGAKRRQPTYDHYTINGLQQAAPAPVGDEVGTDWLKLFQGTFNSIKGANILGTTPIISRETTYILDLVRLISATRKKTIINHIHLYFIERHLAYMPKNITKLLNKMEKQIRGWRPEMLERWQSCVQNHPMQHALSSIYIHSYFPLAEKSKVNELIEDIRNTTEARIQRATWLDTSTKQKALLKLNTMKQVVGSQEWYRDYGSVLQKYYAGQTVGSNYLENILNNERNKYEIELGHQWGGGGTTKSTTQYPILPIAYYQMLNLVVLNVGQMEPPFYSSKFPPVVNYAGLGTVIAHEISHAFGDRGHHYDHKGLRVNWWSTTSLAEYDKRSKCLIDQFNSYGYKELEATHPDWRVKGNFTLSENFADLLGLMISYEAYKTQMQQPIKPSRIGTLPNFDNEKVFFLIYANTFCESTGGQNFEFRTQTDTHASGRLRVNGPLSNMPEFSKAFNCPPGPMNRAMKCKIW